jgi:transcription elongation factor Elf1
MYENCPQCGERNLVSTERWYHGLVSYFICERCGDLFGQAPDGTFVESRYYYEDLVNGYNPYTGTKCTKQK